MSIHFAAMENFVVCGAQALSHMHAHTHAHTRDKLSFVRVRCALSTQHNNVLQQLPVGQPATIRVGRGSRDSVLSVKRANTHTLTHERRRLLSARAVAGLTTHTPSTHTLTQTSPCEPTHLRTCTNNNASTLHTHKHSQTNNAIVSISFPNISIVVWLAGSMCVCVRTPPVAVDSHPAVASQVFRCTIK